MAPRQISSKCDFSTTLSARRVAGALSIGLIVAAAAAIAAPAPAEAKLKIKKLDVSHHDRGRPMIVVRVIDGRWRVTSAIVTLNIDIRTHLNAGHKVVRVDVRFGGKEWMAYYANGKKSRKLKINGARGQWKANTLTGHPVNAGPAFCANSVGRRRGTFNYTRKFIVMITVQDNKGNVKSRDREVEGIYRCIY